MLNAKKYYEAYNDRYRQVHEAGLQWFTQSPTPIVAEVMERFRISSSARVLKIGCGGAGFSADDVRGSPAWIKTKRPAVSRSFFCAEQKRLLRHILLWQWKFEAKWRQYES